MGSSIGGAHAAMKQQKAHLASLIARLRTQRQACQVETQTHRLTFVTIILFQLVCAASIMTLLHEQKTSSPPQAYRRGWEIVLEEYACPSECVCMHAACVSLGRMQPRGQINCVYLCVTRMLGGLKITEFPAHSCRESNVPQVASELASAPYSVLCCWQNWKPDPYLLRTHQRP